MPVPSSPLLPARIEIQNITNNDKHKFRELKKTLTFFHSTCLDCLKDLAIEAEIIADQTGIYPKEDINKRKALNEQFSVIEAISTELENIYLVKNAERIGINCTARGVTDFSARLAIFKMAEIYKLAQEETGLFAHAPAVAETLQEAAMKATKEIAEISAITISGEMDELLGSRCTDRLLFKRNNFPSGSNNSKADYQPILRRVIFAARKLKQKIEEEERQGIVPNLYKRICDIADGIIIPDPLDPEKDTLMIGEPFKRENQKLGKPVNDLLLIDKLLNESDWLNANREKTGMFAMACTNMKEYMALLAYYAKTNEINRQGKIAAETLNQLDGDNREIQTLSPDYLEAVVQLMPQLGETISNLNNPTLSLSIRTTLSRLQQVANTLCRNDDDYPKVTGEDLSELYAIWQNKGYYPLLTHHLEANGVMEALNEVFPLVRLGHTDRDLSDLAVRFNVHLCNERDDQPSARIIGKVTDQLDRIFSKVQPNRKT